MCRFGGCVLSDIILNCTISITAINSKNNWYDERLFGFRCGKIKKDQNIAVQ